VTGDRCGPPPHWVDDRVRQSVLLRPDWPAPAGLGAFTTLRKGPGVGASSPPYDAFNLGDRCGDDPAAVRQNRHALQWIGGLPAVPRWLQQVHGTAVVRFGPDDRGPGIAAPAASGNDGVARPPEADAAITDVPGVVLAILTADCLPVLLCAEDGGEVAAAHAGWRGLAAGVLAQTVARMRTPAPHLLAWLGPAIGPASYEVGEEVRQAFVQGDDEAADAFRPTRPGHFLCDLPALARQRLGQAGVSRVFGGNRCTLAEPAQFFSHRRDGRSGRMASLIWIREAD